MLPDYKEMYHFMFNATEEAINILINAQRKCEELYMDAEEFEPQILKMPEPKATTDDTK